jgi:hypothetical protein
MGVDRVVDGRIGTESLHGSVALDGESLHGRPSPQHIG